MALNCAVDDPVVEAGEVDVLLGGAHPISLMPIHTATSAFLFPLS